MGEKCGKLMGKLTMLLLVTLCNTAYSDNKYKSTAVAEMGDRGHTTHGPKRGGGAVPLSPSAGNPSNTMWTAPRSNSVPSGVSIHRAVATIA